MSRSCFLRFEVELILELKKLAKNKLGKARFGVNLGGKARFGVEVVRMTVFNHENEVGERGKSGLNKNERGW